MEILCLSQLSSALVASAMADFFLWRKRGCTPEGSAGGHLSWAAISSHCIKQLNALSSISKKGFTMSSQHWGSSL